MTTSHTSGAMKAFRRVAWPHRQTYATPLEDLDRFVAAMLSGIRGLTAGRVIVESIVFEPKHLQELMRRYDVPFEPAYDLTITGADPVETAVLLKAALADWVDFAFIPTPKPFVLYGDHDEFTTILAHRRSNLHRATTALDRATFMRVDDYEW